MTVRERVTESKTIKNSGICARVTDSTNYIVKKKLKSICYVAQHNVNELNKIKLKMISI